MTEETPPRGVPLDVLPGIRRIVARNASVMTYHGTNTYLIDLPDGLAVLDPGPRDAAHVREILAAAGETRIRHIILTHAHSDHYGAVAALKEATSAPVTAYKMSGSVKFTADQFLDDGDEIAGFKAVFTPGHAADHLCFEFLATGTGKILFSGDHVMSWSSSIVSPPDGDMLDYYRSLELLLTRDEVLYLPGHGPVLHEPRVLTAELLAHRQFRESTIMHELESQPWAVHALAAKLYNKTNPFLKVAAMRNVLAHMLKLRDEHVAEELAPDPDLYDFSDISAPPGEIEDESGSEANAMRRDAQRRFGLVNSVKN
jgi:glyoxylase-like metal-dependent hydrolase (beta-lactamase superfamily II)